MEDSREEETKDTMQTTHADGLEEISNALEFNQDGYYYQGSENNEGTLNQE
jgi:hypothetical protein